MTLVNLFLMSRYVSPLNNPCKKPIYYYFIKNKLHQKI